MTYKTKSLCLPELEFYTGSRVTFTEDFLSMSWTWKHGEAPLAIEEILNVREGATIFYRCSRADCRCSTLKNYHKIFISRDGKDQFTQTPVFMEEKEKK